MLTGLISGPWQGKQLRFKIGKTSEGKSTRLAPVVSILLTDILVEGSVFFVALTSQPIQQVSITHGIKTTQYAIFRERFSFLAEPTITDTRHHQMVDRVKTFIVKV